MRTTYKQRQLGFRSFGTALFSYMRGFTGLVLSGLSPDLVFVCLSVEYSRYSLPLLSVFSVISPHFISLCSFPPRSPKCKQLLNHKVFIRASGE